MNFINKLTTRLPSADKADHIVGITTTVGLCIFIAVIVYQGVTNGIA